MKRRDALLTGLVLPSAVFAPSVVEAKIKEPDPGKVVGHFTIEFSQDEIEMFMADPDTDTFFLFRVMQERYRHALRGLSDSDIEPHTVCVGEVRTTGEKVWDMGGELEKPIFVPWVGLPVVEDQFGVWTADNWSPLGVWEGSGLEAFWLTAVHLMVRRYDADAPLEANIDAKETTPEWLRFTFPLVQTTSGTVDAWGVMSRAEARAMKDIVDIGPDWEAYWEYNRKQDELALNASEARASRYMHKALEYRKENEELRAQLAKLTSA